MKSKVQTRLTSSEWLTARVSTHCRSAVCNIESHFVFFQDSLLVGGIGIRPSLFLGSNVNPICSDFVMKIQDQYQVRNITRKSRGNFWRKIKNAVSPISKASTKLHQKVCDLKIAIVQVHPFVFKKTSNKSSALVQFLRASYLVKSFATCVTNKSYF